MFGDKLKLLNTEDPMVGYLLPGLRKLNKIRNDLAHNLHLGSIRQGR